MKNLFTLLSLMSAVSVCAQNNIINAINSGGAYTTILNNKVNSPESGKVLNYSEIKGTPYLITNFQNAKVGDFTDVILAKYNSYTDEIEYSSNGKVYSLPKEKNYSPVKLIDSGEKLIYLSDDNFKGYYYILGDGNVKLLRKNVTVFIDEKPAQTSYANSQPAKFEQLKPTYFFYDGKRLIPTKKESELILAFPDKDIAAFLKEKKLKITKEKDLLELQKKLN